MEPTSLFVVFAGDLVAYTAEWPALLAVVGLLVLHVGALEVAHAGRGAPVRHGWWRPVVAFLVVGAVAIGLLAGPSFGAAALGVFRHRAAWGVTPHAASAFAPLLALGLAGFVWATGLTAIAAAWAARTRWSGLGRLLLLGGLVAMAPLAAQMASIVSAGPLPRLALSSPTAVHVGRTLAVVPSVRALEDWDSTPVTSWSPEEPGTRDVRLAASRGVVTVARNVRLEAGAEIGDPRFPLQVGQRVAYADYSLHHTERVLFRGGRWQSHVSESELTMVAVAGVDDTGPIRTFRVVVREPLGGIVEHRVFAWNGELRAYDGSDEVAFLSDDSFLPFGHHTCEWDGQAPGPSSCTVHYEGTVGNGIARALLLVFTIGIVDPGSDARTEGWTRIGYEPGPEGAPAAPVLE